MSSLSADNAAYHNFNKKSFWAQFFTMAQGAFNDNVLKFVIVLFLTAQARESGLKLFGFTLDAVSINAVATVVFSLPFVLFAGSVGALANRYSKRSIILFAKWLEIPIVAGIYVAFDVQSAFLLFTLIFLMAAQSAIFGPAKYGMLPETLPEARLSWANGVFAMGTLVAVILGTGVAGPLHDQLGGQIHQSAILLVVFSVLGLASAYQIQQVPAANPTQRIPVNPWGGLGIYLKAIWQDRHLLHTFSGYIYFWFAGALIQQNVVVYVDELKRSSEGMAVAATGGLAALPYTSPGTFSSVCLAAIAVGIGAGSFFAGIASRRKIELGIVPVGIFGMALFGPLLYLCAGMPWLMVALIAGMGFFGGFFDVPLAATVQKRSPVHLRGGIMATGNMLTFSGMLLAGPVFLALGKLGLNSGEIFLVVAAMSLAVGIYLCAYVPIVALRAVMWLLTNTIYRIQVIGRANIPDQGAALFVSNHLSVVDAIFMLSATDRQIHFVVGPGALEQRWSKRLAEVTRMIVFDPDAAPSQQAAALAEVRAVLAEGHVVCISTEGPHHADGTLAAFQRDLSVLSGDAAVPVHPVYMSKSWGVVYDVVGGALRWLKVPFKPYPVVVGFGEAVPNAMAERGAERTRRALGELGVRVYTERAYPFRQLHHGFIRAARRRLFRMAIADTVSGELNYFKTLVGSIVFARKLKAILDGQEMVGLLVPPSVGGLLANVAVQMLGKVPVNLNYTASNEALASCGRQCNLTQVLTSKKLLDRLPIVPPGAPIFLEDIKETVTGKDRIVAMVLALFAPIWLIEKVLGTPKKDLDALGTIIFSSGSEGDPKGVMLTQRNIAANAIQGYETFPHDQNTCMVGFLPFFHSFGYTVTVWLVLVWGLRAIYHSNPLEPKVIGGLIEKHRATLMIGTSTFLQHFIRKCTTEQMKSLEFVVCGAEKLAPRVRDAFKEKFGVEPLEGYGTTECAPAVSINAPDLVSPGMHAKLVRRGTIGRALPGQVMRVVDPDTEVELPLGEPGLLQVKGPNIMRGYLHLEEKTAKVLQDGWYSTGDIAAIDFEGFVTITDRLARFSKIAGEMVPHNKVEETMHDLLGLTEQSMAVASVPDAQKGERLVVLHTLDDAQLETLLGKLGDSGLPNLWIPRASSFHRVEGIPVLATGKMDIKTVKKLATELDAEG